MSAKGDAKALAKRIRKAGLRVEQLPAHSAFAVYGTDGIERLRFSWSSFTKGTERQVVAKLRRMGITVS